MNVFAFSSARVTEWRWRIVDLQGEMLEESSARFPDHHRGAGGRDRTASGAPRARSSAAGSGAMASPSMIDPATDADPRTAPLVVARVRSMAGRVHRRRDLSAPVGGPAAPAAAPHARSGRLPAPKVVLFCEWLDMVARRPAVRAHFARQKIRVRVMRQDERAPCLACEPLNAREVGLELDAMPPFHPGCRCVLVAMHAIRRPARKIVRAPSFTPRVNTGSAGSGRHST